MRYRVLALFPLVIALAFAVATATSGADATLVVTLGSVVGKLLALSGSFAAALAFERGDYLRRAWLLSGSCFLLLLVGDALAATGGGGEAVVWSQAVVGVLANAASVIGTWMLAHAFGASGLDHDEADRRRRRLVLALSMVLAVAVTGWPLLSDGQHLLRGDPAALTSVASDLGDAICFALIAPVLETAIALRGGLLRWPWAFLTASGASWVFYDASSSLVAATSAGGRWLVASEVLRMLGNGFVFSAGLAQRWAVAPEPPAAGSRGSA